jgi:hypothetical protein
VVPGAIGKNEKTWISVAPGVASGRISVRWSESRNGPNSDDDGAQEYPVPS